MGLHTTLLLSQLCRPLCSGATQDNFVTGSLMHPHSQYSLVFPFLYLASHPTSRHEARDIIRNATQASEHDRVVFVGSGATGALHKLIHSLALDFPPVVLVGPFAHHSSLLPWRELGAKVLPCVWMLFV